MLFLVESLYPRARLSATELRKLLPEAAIFIGRDRWGFIGFTMKDGAPVAAFSCLNKWLNSMVYGT
jgi:hypothetical protein